MEAAFCTTRSRPARYVVQKPASIETSSKGGRANRHTACSAHEKRTASTRFDPGGGCSIETARHFTVRGRAGRRSLRTHCPACRSRHQTPIRGDWGWEGNSFGTEMIGGSPAPHEPEVTTCERVRWMAAAQMAFRARFLLLASFDFSGRFLAGFIFRLRGSRLFATRTLLFLFLLLCGRKDLIPPRCELVAGAGVNGIACHGEFLLCASGQIFVRWTFLDQ